MRELLSFIPIIVGDKGASKNPQSHLQRVIQVRCPIRRHHGKDARLCRLRLRSIFKGMLYAKNVDDRLVRAGCYDVPYSLTWFELVFFDENCPYFGAGWQVQYPYFCPDFVLCLEYGQYMSSICPKYVLVPYMTNMCLQNPNFVPVKSSFCPLEPTFVLFSSFLLAKMDWKIGRQKWVKVWIS